MSPVLTFSNKLVVGARGESLAKQEKNSKRGEEHFARIIMEFDDDIDPSSGALGPIRFMLHCNFNAH